MSERRLNSKAHVGIVAVLLPIVYGGAYLLMVTPVMFVDEALHGVVLSGAVVPKYVGKSETIVDWPNHPLSSVFIPANWLDRKVRPSVWEIPPVPESREAVAWRELTMRQRDAVRSRRN